MLPLCREEGIAVIPWKPVAGGFVMGTRSREGSFGTLRARTDAYAQGLYNEPSDFEVVDRITQVARARGVSNAQVALAWMLQKPGITAPVVGASKMQHLEDAVAAVELKLDDAEVKALEEPYLPHRILGHA